MRGAGNTPALNRECRSSDQGRLERRAANSDPNAERLILLDELRVEQDGCPAILLSKQLLAEHFDASGAVLTKPGLGIALLHLGNLTRA